MICPFLQICHIFVKQFSKVVHINLIIFCKISVKKITMNSSHNYRYSGFQSTEYIKVSNYMVTFHRTDSVSCQTDTDFKCV